MMKSAAFLLAASSCVSGVVLTDDNFSDLTAGKTVFVKFYAPWCGHCKAMAPAWEKLMDEYNSNAQIVVGEADCTGAGEKLCQEFGVQGFPSIKHGDPAALEDYEGGRSFEDLSEFAGTLKPLCSPLNMDLCDAEDKEKLEALMATPIEELENTVEEGEKKIKDAEEHFETELEKLQQAYQKLEQEKEDIIKEVKNSGLGRVKSVIAALKTKKGDAKEEL